MPKTPLLPHRLYITGTGFDPLEFFVGCNADIADGPGGVGSRGLAPNEQALSFNFNRADYALAKNCEWLQTGKQARITVVCDANPAPTVDADYYGPTAIEEALADYPSDVVIQVRNGTYDMTGVAAIAGNNVRIEGISIHPVNGVILDWGANDLTISGFCVSLSKMAMTFDNTHGVIWSGLLGQVDLVFLTGKLVISGDWFRADRINAAINTPASTDTALHLNGCACHISNSIFDAVDGLALDLQGTLYVFIENTFFESYAQVVRTNGLVKGRGSFVNVNFANYTSGADYFTGHSDLGFDMSPDSQFSMTNCLFDIRNCSRLGVGAVAPYVSWSSVGSTNTRIKVVEGTYYRDDPLLLAWAGIHHDLQVDFGPAQATATTPTQAAVMSGMGTTVYNLYLEGQLGVWDTPLVAVGGTASQRGTVDGLRLTGDGTWSNAMTPLVAALYDYGTIRHLNWDDEVFDDTGAPLLCLVGTDPTTIPLVFDIEIDQSHLLMQTRTNTRALIGTFTDGEDYRITNNYLWTDGHVNAWSDIFLVAGAVQCAKGTISGNRIVWNAPTVGGGGPLLRGPVIAAAGVDFWRVEGNEIEGDIASMGAPGWDNLVYFDDGALENCLGGGNLVDNNILRNLNAGPSVAPHVASASGVDQLGFGPGVGVPPLGFAELHNVQAFV